MSIEGRIERENGEWEPVELSVETVRDIERIQAIARGREPNIADLENIGEEDVELFKEEASDAFLYRRGREAVGCLVFSPPIEGVDVLHVEDLSILPQYRSAGTTAKLLKLIQKQAQLKGATKVTWVPASHIMEKLTKKIGAEDKALHVGLGDGKQGAFEYKAVPIERLDQATLIEMLRK